MGDDGENYIKANMELWASAQNRDGKTPMTSTPVAATLKATVKGGVEEGRISGFSAGAEKYMVTITRR